MRTALVLAVVLAGALHSPAALAQYQNRSIGLSAGYWDLQEAAGLSYAIPVGLTATNYFDNGIEGVVHALGMLTREPISGDLAFGFSLQLGARYLFLQGELLRPYAGLHASYFHVFPPEGSATKQYVGVGPELGVEYFLMDAVSVGVRGEYNVYFHIRDPLQTGFGISLDLAFWY